MLYLHPVFMVVVLILLFKLHAIGKQAMKINPKSPEAEQKEILQQQHRKLSIILTAMMFAGLCGGVFAVFQFMGIREIFLKTYGHGFAGAIVLGLMLANIFVGKSVKVLAKDKARNNLLKFHNGLFYFAIATSAYSLISGIVILVKGPMA